MAITPTIRGRRYRGEPQMKFVSLILGGLQAITVFSDAVLVRLALSVTLIAGASSLAVVLLRLLTDWVVLGWASNMMGFFGVVVLTVLFGLMSTSLLALQACTTMQMIPFLHADMYVAGVRRLLG